MARAFCTYLFLLAVVVYTISTASRQISERQPLRMIDERNPESPGNQTMTVMNTRAVSARSNQWSSILLRSLLVGIIITLILSIIELGLLWIVNPQHLLGNGGAHQFQSLVALPAHFPVLWLIPLIELAGTTVVAFMATRPLALRAYLRELHSAQEQYRMQHTSLSSLNDTFPTPVTYYQHTPDPNTSAQAQALSLITILEQPGSLLLLGDAGAGKTLAWHYYLSRVAEQGWARVRGGGSIPVYIPLADYSMYLSAATGSDRSNGGNVPATLLDFLYETNLPGVQHLRPHLNALLKHGRLELLCDGLDEVASDYRETVSRQLANLMLITRNRYVISARETDYRQSQQLLELVDGGDVARAVIPALAQQSMREWIEQFVEGQGNQWHHTAGQVMQTLSTGNARDLCTNPMLLSLLLEVVAIKGLDEVRVLETRGRLLQVFIEQRIEQVQRRSAGDGGMPSPEDVIQFLSVVACAAGWAGNVNALLLSPQGQHGQDTVAVTTVSLLAWLDEHPAHNTFGPGQLTDTYDAPMTTALLRCALDAGLIDISMEGTLSFRHELIAACCAADYFKMLDSGRAFAFSPSAQQFLTDYERWSAVVALWAGLAPNPFALAERFVMLGQNNGNYLVPALTLALLCAGVAWRSPQANGSQPVQLPARVMASVTAMMQDETLCEQFAQSFTRCAGAGGEEMYRSLLFLLPVEGIELLLMQLDEAKVIDLLFRQLVETADVQAYDAQLKRLVRVLGMLGGAVVERAGALSQPLTGRSPRLRAAAVNILGGTGKAGAVEPLMARLNDPEPFIADRAVYGLVRLGPALSLQAVSDIVENPGAGEPLHRAGLTILERFLNDKTTRNLAAIRPGRVAQEPDAQSVNNVRILHTIISTLAAPYTREPAVQQQAQESLLRLAQNSNTGNALSVVQAPDAQATGPQSVSLGYALIGFLTLYLSSDDTTMVHNAMQVLEAIGDEAIPALLEQLNQQLPEASRIHLVEVLRAIHDPRALPAILRMIADPSLLVQQQVAQALDAFQPDSIDGLIDLVLEGENDMVAEKAAHMLGDMGTVVVAPIMQSLSYLNTAVGVRLGAKRIRLLVYVLERVHDPVAIPALVNVLTTAQPEPLLAVAIVHALGQFREEAVVAPLIVSLGYQNQQVYEEAIKALSGLGDIALPNLVAALDNGQESNVVTRIRRAILAMTPFPGEQLIAALRQSGKDNNRAFQVQQILLMLRAQGPEAARVMVKYLFDSDPRIRDYMRWALGEMSAPVVIPALIEGLDVEAQREGIAELLLRYPEAIAALVALLGELGRGEAAVMILPRYGVVVLPALIPALDDSRLMAQEQAQSIIVALVRQDEAMLAQVVGLFATKLPLRAHEALIEVLTNELADVSVPALLDSLDDADLIEDVSIALARLVPKRAMQPVVIQGLLDALRDPTRRQGAGTALVKISGPAVQPVGALITDPDQEVAIAAQRVLGAIGVPALSFIWAAHGDTTNRARHEAAMQVFRAMPTNVIKDALVQLLSNDLADDMSMALSLLLERIHDESALPLEQQEMVPTLLEYVQIHEGERISMRITALLLLPGNESVVNHVLQVLYMHPEEYEYPEQLLSILLFQRQQSERVLAGVLNDPHAPGRLRAEAIALLGMMGHTKDVVDYAGSLSTYGLAAGRNNVLYPEQLAVGLRALGGLLVSGHWDVETLKEMYRTNREGTPQHELFGALLGQRNEPAIASLRNKMQTETESHQREIMMFTARIVNDQDRIADLENELNRVRQEHGQRGDELYQTAQEREAIRGRLDQATREKQQMQDYIEQLQQDNLALTREVEDLRGQQGA